MDLHKSRCSPRFYIKTIIAVLFINDIVNEFQSDRLFADDASLYLISEHPDVTAYILNKDLETITVPCHI